MEWYKNKMYHIEGLGISGDDMGRRDQSRNLDHLPIADLGRFRMGNVGRRDKAALHS